MAMQKPTRRDFLKFLTRGLLAGSGLLGLGVLARYLGYQVESPMKTEFDLGAAENYPTGSRTLLAEVPAVLHPCRRRFFRVEPDLHPPGLHPGGGW